jgi:hypothetical protein
MHRKKLISKIAVGGAAAAMALGAVACDAEENDMAPGQEEPADDGFEGEGDLGGDLEGEGDLGGEGELEGEGGLEGEGDFEDFDDEGDDF